MKQFVGAVFARFRRSKLLSFILKAGFTVLAFWLVMHDIDFVSSFNMLHGQNVLLLLASVLLMFMQMTFGAFRWRLILVALSKEGAPVISLFEACKIYYISTFFNYCLPGTVGGDVVRVWLAKSEHIPLPLSINS